MTRSLPLNPPHRLLMGPGPINAYPQVLRAMSAPLIGQFDPAMLDFMDQTMVLYRQVFCTVNDATVLVDGTSRAGIEALMVSLIEPGERVLVASFGRFGQLLQEVAERCDAEVHVAEVPWGEVFTSEQIEAEIRRVRPAVLVLVQGDTSTTVCQPLADIGEICRRYDVLSYVDATASIGGNTLLTDTWGLDAVSAGLQKCLGGPAGSAPVTLSERAVAKVRKRRHVEAGIRGVDDVGVGTRIRSNYFDMSQILDYWSPSRLNHHTEASTMLYAAYECARLLADEGVDDAVARHELNGRAMAEGIRALGLGIYGDQANRMNNVIGVVIPDGVDGDGARRALLDDHAIEIGTSFGPLHGRIWRVGVMGYNARRDAVMNTLNGLEAVLRRGGVKMTAGAGCDAALAVYGAAA